jgi:hypothetical protein
MLFKISPSRCKASSNYVFRDVVSTLANALGHTRHGGIGIRQSEKTQADSIPIISPLLDVLQLPKP